MASNHTVTKDPVVSFGKHKLYHLYKHRMRRGDGAHDAVLDTCPEVDDLRTLSPLKALLGCMNRDSAGPEWLTKDRMDTFEVLSAAKETDKEQEKFQERCLKNLTGCWECELCGFDRNFLQNRHTRQAIQHAATEQAAVAAHAGSGSEGEESDQDSEVSWCSNVSRDSGKSKQRTNTRETTKQRNEKRLKRRKEREKRKAKRDARRKARAEKLEREQAKRQALQTQQIGTLSRGRRPNQTMTKRPSGVSNNNRSGSLQTQSSIHSSSSSGSSSSGSSDDSDRSRSSRSRASSTGSSPVGKKHVARPFNDPSGALAGMSEFKKARVLQEGADWVNSRKHREVRFFPRCRLCGRKTGLGVEQKYFLGIVGSLKESVKLKKEEGLLLRKGLPSRRMKVEDEIHKLQSWIVYGAFGADDEPRYHGFPRWAEEIWLLRQSYVERHDYWWCCNGACRWPRNLKWSIKCAKCDSIQPKKNWEYWLAWRRTHYRELGNGLPVAEDVSGSSESAASNTSHGGAKDNRTLKTAENTYVNSVGRKPTTPR